VAEVAENPIDLSDNKGDKQKLNFKSISKISSNQRVQISKKITKCMTSRFPFMDEMPSSAFCKASSLILHKAPQKKGNIANTGAAGGYKSS
jgi:hypothetical protein